MQRQMLIRRVYALLIAVFLFSLANFFVSGCATTKLKKIKALHESGKYQDVIKPDNNCTGNSAECFQIKLLRADSYYRLGDYSQSLRDVNEAINKISPEIPRDNVETVYALRANLLFEQLKSTDDFEKKKTLVHSLERDLNQALATSEELPASEQKEINERKLYLLQAETLLMKMDLVEIDSLGIVYGHLQEVAATLGKLTEGEGYEQYYSLRGKFKDIQPQVKQVIFGGEGDREELLGQLTQIYQQGVTLRNLPIYQAGYAGAIDRFLENVDLFMKQLAL